MAFCEPLSSRETETLARVAQGWTREEIGLHLYVSPWTVKSDLDRIREKLNAASLPHAVAIGFMLGLLDVLGDDVCVSHQLLIAA